MKTETADSLNIHALNAALFQLQEAAKDIEYALSRIAASKDKTLGEGTAAFRIQRAGECRDSAAENAELAAKILRTLATRK